MRKIFIIFIMASMAGTGLAQENDTAILRKTGVSYIEHRSYMAIYGERADTCVESKIWINEYGLTVKEIVDHNCTGWNAVIETQYTYDEKNRLIKQMVTSNNAIQSQSKFEYNDKDDVVRFEILTFDPVSTVEGENIHFYNENGLIDSTYRLTIVNLDTNKQVDRITYTDDRQIKFIKTFGEENQHLLTNEYIYDEAGRIFELNVEIMVPEYHYSKNLYTYNAEGQLFTSTNTDQGSTLQRYYSKEGLLILSTQYNQFGQLVRNVHFKYSYH